MSCHWREEVDYTEYPSGSSALEVDDQPDLRVGEGLCIEATDNDNGNGNLVSVFLNREQVTHLCSQLTRALESWK